MLFTKGEHINNFITLLQSTQNHNKEAQPEPYNKLKEKIDEENNGKMEKAQLKLYELLRAYAADNENKKRASMVSEEVQADEDETG